ncbi:MAG: SCP-2 sterol transfer family protein [Lachnospiraceae bacterium]|nr:SCP-2 sterol transfer family protein [Lachnospiraceae bacterium]
MKINIYYGGRGIMGDPTLFVLSKMQAVLEELNVKVVRYNLHDEKKNITSLPSTLNDADAVILATTVEWYGVGGYMAEFMDACWYYGNKEKISSIYMCPVVMSTTYGEREAQLTLISAWDMLGGKTISGISGYVKDNISFESNQDYISTVEKIAENFYRNISRKAILLPVSTQEVRGSASHKAIELTPQETEQLSKYASDDNFVQTQKEDIKELTNHFRTLLKNDGVAEEDVILQKFKEKFKPDNATEGIFQLAIKEFSKPLNLDVQASILNPYYGVNDEQSVLCRLDKAIVNEIIAGKITFQEAFRTGDMQVRGDFSQLRLLDELFPFKNKE